MYSPFIVLKFEIAGTYHNPFFRCLQFGVGVGVAAVLKDMQDKKAIKFLFTWKCFWLELIILGIIVSVLFPCFSSFGNVSIWIGLPMSILMVISLSGVKLKRNFVTKVLVYLSSISYAFYLAQFFTWEITNIILKFFRIRGTIALTTISLGISLTLCVLISITFHEIIERPISKYLKKYNCLQ